MLALSGKGRSLIKAGEIDKGLALLDEATRLGDVRRSPGALGRARLLHHDQLVPGPRRLPARGRVDGGGEPLVRHARRHGLPRRVSDPPRGGHAATRRLAGRRGAGRRGVRGAPRLRPHASRPAATTRSARSGVAAATSRAPRRRIASSNEMGRDPQPGLSLLRLAEGKIDAAVAGITRTLAGRSQIRSSACGVFRRRSRSRSPPAISRRPAPRPTRASRSSTRTRSVVGAPPRSTRPCTSRVARSGSPSATGPAAIAALQRARDEWQGVGAPYETARARALLGIAYTRSGDEHAGTAELEAALATFERLGAPLDEARVKELLGRVEARRTFLFTDIVDSTKLLETLGDDKWKRLLARHNELVRECIADAGGEVVKQTGDGFFASFENPKAAIDAAVGIQRALADEIVAPDVRIGAHSGGAFRTEADSTDYGGQGVHVAARIGSAAQAGEILDQRRDSSTASARRSGSPSRARRRSRGSSSPSRSSPSTGARRQRATRPSTWRRRSHGCERAPRGAARPCARGEACRVRA